MSFNIKVIIFISIVIDNFLIIEGKFKNYMDLEDLVIKHENQDNVYLRDVADISFTDADTTSYARQNNQPVVMLDVKKRAGANIINAIDQIKVVVEGLQKSFPKNMKLTYTNDQSIMIRSQISNLENSIVFFFSLKIKPNSLKSFFT